MQWTVLFHHMFEAEFAELPLGVKEAMAATANMLETHGPMLGRPHADTLAGSKHANMKELRFNADDGVWRVAFAFDPARKGIVLVAGDKAGVAQKRFYKTLIAKADARFAEHLETVKLSTAGTHKHVKG
jgi:hypothetical protein